MFKKALVFTVVFLLLAPLALAAGPQGGNAPANQQLRLGAQRLRQAEARQAKLEVRADRRANTDPAILKEQLLARHAQMIVRATNLLASQATLPAKIVSDLVAAQARALALATTQAETARNPALAARRLAQFKESQAKKLAHVTENATSIAAKMVERAETFLKNAAEIRAKIESGEIIEKTGQRLEKRIERLEEQIEKFRASRNKGR